MKWAKFAVALSVVLLVGGFVLATEVAPSVTVDGQRYRCMAAIKSDWLVSGTSSDRAAGTRTVHRDPLVARVDAACGRSESRARWTLGTVLALGVLLLVGGSSVLRENADDDETPALQLLA